MDNSRFLPYKGAMADIAALMARMRDAIWRAKPTVKRGGYFVAGDGIYPALWEATPPADRFVSRTWVDEGLHHLFAHDGQVAWDVPVFLREHDGYTPLPEQVLFVVDGETFAELADG